MHKTAMYKTAMYKILIIEDNPDIVANIYAFF